MSDVFYIPISSRKDLLKKIFTGMDKCNLKAVAGKNNLVAVKVHFGEHGNLAFIKPAYLNFICQHIEEEGGRPFLTDTNTLYRGERSNSVSHIKNALFNGFGNYPIIIADGLRGESYEEIEINGEMSKTAYIGSDIYYSDGLVIVSHFKGHDLSGFGGAIKNIGMGGASKKGKLSMHSNIHPNVNEDKCIGCMICSQWCNYDAIEKKNDKSHINPDRCTGCGLCIETCPQGAIKINWDIASDDMQKRLAEYAYGAVKGKKCIYINFVQDITPSCDCFPYSDKPVAPDVGVLVSGDPVAIDRASYDLVNEKAGRKVFEEIHESVNCLVQLEHGEKTGLGSNEYTLREL
ncbi:MAG: DUF362 domain-containing protein [bacterium]